MKKVVVLLIGLCLSNLTIAQCIESNDLKLVEFKPTNLAIYLPENSTIERSISNYQNDYTTNYNVLYKNQNFKVIIESRHPVDISNLYLSSYKAVNIPNISDESQLRKWECNHKVCSLVLFNSGSVVSDSYNTTVSYVLTPEDDHIGDEFINALFINRAKGTSQIQEPDIVNNLLLKINIEFKAGSSVIEHESSQIADFAKVVNENNAKIMIDGHTDQYEVQGGYTIDDERSFNLSKRRAEALRDLLILNYAVRPGNIIEIVGAGHLRPIAPNDNESDRQKNRRVQAYIL